VPYEIESIRHDDVKRKRYLAVNPNGRVPAMEDPNTDLTLWESGAIIHYVIKHYDTEHRLSYDTLKEQELCIQWLMFQVSGQGPYFGQCAWFSYLHAEKIPSAIERYSTEIKRILGVLESVLSAKPKSAQFLVGDRLTYADLSFAPYNRILDILLGVPDDQKFAGFPHVQAWHEAMIQRPSWKRAMEVRAVKMDEQDLDWNGMPKGTKTYQEFEEKIAAQNAEEDV